MVQDNSAQGTGADIVSLMVAQERRLIRAQGSHRHLVFRVKVAPANGDARREPVSIALVLDRSGSMHGEKIDTARRAAQLVLNALDERDRLAVVAFDSDVNVLQSATPVTAEVKRRLHRELAKLEAGSNTALHEGWLTGCREIAVDGTPTTGGTARCLLLTDGLANEGPTDPEQLAAAAAGVRKMGGVGTSTFGIGPDYDEGLLGPMAVAGGGQFHHLRSAAEIVDTFEGEISELFATAVADARLEVEAGPGCRLDLVSEYWVDEHRSDTGASLVAAIGNLRWSEERSVVVRVSLPPATSAPNVSLRARLTWRAGEQRQATEWRDARFTYASGADCDAELRDPVLMRAIGLQHADRAQRDAAVLNRKGELPRARRRLERVAERIRRYEGDDPQLNEARRELLRLAREAGDAVMAPMVTKELYSSAQRRSRGQTDYRRPPA
jgi:Ca-activated chloride channel homolog